MYTQHLHMSLQVSKVTWACWAHDARRPCAILTCCTPQHPSQTLHVCLVPCAPAHVFKLPRLAPQRNSVRSVAGGGENGDGDAVQDDSQLPATPVYNQGIVMVRVIVGCHMVLVTWCLSQRILFTSWSPVNHACTHTGVSYTQDMLLASHMALVEASLTTAPNAQHAALLLAAWLRAQGLHAMDAGVMALVDTPSAEQGTSPSDGMLDGMSRWATRSLMAMLLQQDKVVWC